MSADIVQSNSGGFNTLGTSNATLPVGTTAGNTVIIRAFIWSATGTVSTPTGFTLDSPDPIGSQRGYVWRKSNVGAGETSWGITTVTTAGPLAWWVDEISGLDVELNPRVVVTPWTTATALSVSTGTTPFTTAYEALALALHGGYDAASATGPTWSGHTNSFVEQGEQAQVSAGGTTSVGMSVSSKLLSGSLATVESTATSSLGSNGPLGAAAVVYALAGSTHDARLAVIDGFERGSIAGADLGLNGVKQYDVKSGSPAVVATNPRTGSYCLELSSVAAVEWVGWGSNTLGTNKITLVLRFSVYFPGSLPASDVVLSYTASATSVFRLRFRVATAQLGVQIGTDTEQLGPVVAADTWYEVDLRYDTFGAALKTDWRVDGVAQTRATGSGAEAALGLFIGWDTAITATVRFDDIAVSTVPAAYPLGDVQVRVLKPDPGGTLTLGGTAASTDFNVFSNNGPPGVWNAATALTAISEAPPTIGAAADGFMQVVNDATAYVEIPMQTYQAIPDQSIRAVRLYACGWSATTAAATIGFRGWDGVAEVVLQAGTADPEFDASTTTPAWVCKMFRPVDSVWTQAKLDALAFRVGYSNDTNPLGSSPTSGPTGATANAQTVVNGTWTNGSNAHGVEDGTVGTWTSTTSGGTTTIELSAYGAWAGIPAGSAIEAVSVSVSHWLSASTARMASLTAQLFVGATGKTPAQALTLTTTSGNTDTFAVTQLPTLAELQGNTILIRLIGTRAAVTQACNWLIDAAEITVTYTGSSGIGVHSVTAEVAVQATAVETVIGEAGSVEASASKDPTSGGTLGVTVDTPADQGATLNWVADAVPGSQVVGPSGTHTEVFDAVDSSTVTFVEVVSDPEFSERE